MKYINLYVTALSLVALTACDTEDLKKADFNYPFDSTKVPVVKTEEVMGNYGVSLRIAMQTESNQHLDTVMQQGILFSSDPNMDIMADTLYPAKSNQLDRQIVVIENLESEKDYYYCAYSQNQDGLALGEMKKVTTAHKWLRLPLYQKDFRTEAPWEGEEPVLEYSFGSQNGIRRETFSKILLDNMAKYAYYMLSYDLQNNNEPYTEADDLIQVKLDLTGGVLPEFKFFAFSFGAEPINTSNMYFDAFEVIASEELIDTKEKADAAKVYARIQLDENSVNKMQSIRLPDFEGKVCYVAIRHKFQPQGFALGIAHLEGNMLIDPNL